MSVISMAEASSSGGDGDLGARSQLRGKRTFLSSITSEMHSQPDCKPALFFWKPAKFLSSVSLLGLYMVHLMAK